MEEGRKRGFNGSVTVFFEGERARRGKEGGGGGQEQYQTLESMDVGVVSSEDRVANAGHVANI